MKEGGKEVGREGWRERGREGGREIDRECLCIACTCVSVCGDEFTHFIYSSSSSSSSRST